MDYVWFIFKSNCYDEHDFLNTNKSNFQEICSHSSYLVNHTLHFSQRWSNNHIHVITECIFLECLFGILMVVYQPSCPVCTPMKRDVLVLTIQILYVFVLQQLGIAMALSDLCQVYLFVVHSWWCIFVWQKMVWCSVWFCMPVVWEAVKIS